MPTTEARRRGWLITFEGLDGCGKTTQISRLASRLRQADYVVSVTSEPGGTTVGEQIRRILLDVTNNNMVPLTEVLLYFASRVQNLEECIRPALARGEVVIVDRFTDSTIAYQGYGRRLGPALIERLHELLCGGVQPDLTILLDLEPEVALARATHRNQHLDDAGQRQLRMDLQPLEFYARVRAGYQELAKKYSWRYRLIDASQPPEHVEAAVWQAVRGMLEQAGAVQD